MIPNGVPIGIPIIAVFANEFIALGSGETGGEGEGGPAIVVAVYVHFHPIAGEVIPPRHDAGKLIRLGILGVIGQVEILIVVENLEGCLTRGRDPFHGISLKKIACPIHLVPH